MSTKKSKTNESRGVARTVNAPTGAPDSQGDAAATGGASPSGADIAEKPKKEKQPKPATDARREGFDPKNRLVTLTPSGKSFTVSKPATGYKEKFASLEKAEAAFLHKTACSHN